MSDGIKRLIEAKAAAEAAGLSLAAFWRSVESGRLPAPVYPASRAPRWYLSEIYEALEATRQKPRDALTARRAAKLASCAA
jgi:predicted DNA-binding transcriptional regulator AlpA